jgi:hypothetical protein
MKKCPVCDRENFDDALTCASCRRYLPQPNYNEKYTLVSFLRKNEVLFTIMGVFLVLALIFNSPQLTITTTPQFQTTITTASNNSLLHSDGLSELNATYQLNQSNLSEYSNVTPNKNEIKISELYADNAMLFVFLCLWVSIIIFLVIFADLCCTLRYAFWRLIYHLRNFRSKEEFIEDSSILIIAPPFFGIALWFIALLLQRFPQFSANAVLITVLEVYLIEVILLAAAVIAVFNAKKGDRQKILAFAIACIALALALCWLIYSTSDTASILLFPAIIVLFGAGIFGIYRFFRTNDQSYEESNG